ncbi:ATP-binding protein [Kitasatospora sp. NPDC051853]|uniref:ATP-binding protein n=1 Tax=Kitasatospora sp. NPDC051853 TaxID=3364058 RepID=UPI0037AD6D49
MIAIDQTAPVLAVREGSAACAMPADPAAVPALRHFAQVLARQWEVPDSVEEALALIVTELVANAVRHSGSPEVALLLASDGVTVVVQVRDNGHWRPQAATGPEDCTGRGLMLVEAYAAGCTIRRTGSGTQVTAELLVPEAA